MAGYVPKTNLKWPSCFQTGTQSSRKSLAVKSASHISVMTHCRFITDFYFCHPALDLELDGGSAQVYRFLWLNVQAEINLSTYK